ncbi:MAG TPA: hypothetical protein VHP33_41635 [Polyangiaceae bacterium]|nr:hypothetical protein [Polyangiaceae bacterium]
MSRATTARRDRAALGLACALAVGFLGFVHLFYPLWDWLFFRYLAYFAVAGVCLTSSGLAGHFVLKRVLGLRLPRHEHVVQSLAVGLFGFTLGWFALGIARCWSPLSALLWPLIYAAPGLTCLRERGSWLRWLRAHGPVRVSGLGLAGAALGLLGLVLVYLPLIHPNNLTFDARFYHQALAEHYVAEQGITPFRDGWIAAACPQLATYLYSWAYALPSSGLFDRIELAVHLEFALFLVTLASVPVLAARLAPRRRLPLAWLALLAFPELYCYDSMLSGSADHVAAVFAVPLFLALLRALPSLEPRACTLLGLVCAAVLSTKYTAYGLLLVPLAALVGRAAQLLITTPGRGRWWLLRGPSIAALLAIVLWSPHWLKNLLWYGDPVYPFLHAHLRVEPWVPHADERFSLLLYKGQLAERSLTGVVQSLTSAFTFSFLPQDWWLFHRDLPIFGSLFSFSLPFALLLRSSRRYWLLYGAVLVAVVYWFWSYHLDRYLQVLVPWMAVIVAVTASSLWQLGVGGRAAVLLLGGVQLVWGADVPFFPTHALTGTSGHQVSIKFLSSGFTREADRFRVFGDYTDLGRALPRGAKVLLHDNLLRLGLGTAVVSDAAIGQLGIEYAVAPSARGVFERLRELGVSHLVWEPGRSQGWDSLAGDIAFHRLASRYAVDARDFGAFRLAAMPPTPPPRPAAPEQVLLLTCGATYARGSYQLMSLSVQPLAAPRPARDYPKPERAAPDEAVPGLAEQAVALVVNPRCYRAKLPDGFSFAFRSGADVVYLRDAAP